MKLYEVVIKPHNYSNDTRTITVGARTLLGATKRAGIYARKQWTHPEVTSVKYTSTVTVVDR